MILKRKESRGQCLLSLPPLGLRVYKWLIALAILVLDFAGGLEGMVNVATLLSLFVMLVSLHGYKVTWASLRRSLLDPSARREEGRVEVTTSTSRV
jgi:hypothetical protein